jgi:hypothetical protein
MKLTHLITLFLSLSILFSNMAWAMDECSLTDEFSTQALNSLDIASEDHTLSNNPTGNTCNSSCAGWNHLNYLTYTTPFVSITKLQNTVAAYSITYYFTLKKPLVKPPNV